MISDSWMQELLSKNDIASVIGEYTQLTPKGGKLWACCPFHGEKTPSFNVDTANQLYYCFGCHKGGNVITFIKEKEQLSGREALKFLADRVGMLMPENGFDEQQANQQKQLRQRLYNANREAARYYFKNLTESAQALEYLHKRNLSDGIIKRFGLGFALNEWTALCDHLKSIGYTEDELVKAGLARKNEKGRVYDAFRNRIIFPIIDERSNVLAFGGRTMGDDKPKYLNTGDTPIYNKRRNLYGLNLMARTTQNDIILVEGYMDVISLHSSGVSNVVASLGTALTENQAQLLKRRTNKVFVSYDGDSAGQNATMRGLDILANCGLEVRVIVLPNGLDPDDFAKKFGKEGYMRLKDQSQALNTFKIEHIAQNYNLADADERQKFAIEACKLVASLQPIEQERYFALISKKTGISYETLSAQVKGLAITPEKRNTFTNIRNNREKTSTFTAYDRYEALLISCAISDGSAAGYITKNAVDFITRPETISFLNAVNESFMQNGLCNAAAILNTVDGNTAHIAAAIMNANVFEPYKTAVDCINRLKIEKLENQLRELSAAYDAGSIGIDEYKMKYAEIMHSLKLLKS